MLSPAQVERLARNLAHIKLDPVVYFSIGAAIADALLNNEGNLPVNSGNGATPPGIQSRKRRKRHGRRGIRSGEGIARARQVFKQHPEMTTGELGKAAGVSFGTAKRAKQEAHQAA